MKTGNMIAKNTLLSRQERVRMLVKTAKYAPAVRETRLRPGCFKTAKITKNLPKCSAKVHKRPQLIISIPLCDTEADTACTGFSQRINESSHLGHLPKISEIEHLMSLVKQNN